MNFLRKLFSSSGSPADETAPPDDHTMVSAQPSLPTPMDTACPYCGVALNPVPQRKKKCKDCGNFVYVRTRPEDGRRVLATEQQANELEANWQRVHEQRSALDKLRQIGLNKIQELRYSERIPLLAGQSGKLRDLLWEAMSERIRDAMQQQDWQALSFAYRLQADQLYEEGRPHFDVQREAERAGLRNYLNVTAHVKVMTANDERCCSKCRAAAGRTYQLEVAMVAPPVPVADCERGLCRCWCSPVIDTHLTGGI